MDQPHTPSANGRHEAGTDSQGEDKGPPNGGPTQDGRPALRLVGIPVSGILKSLNHLPQLEPQKREPIPRVTQHPSARLRVIVGREPRRPHGLARLCLSLECKGLPHLFRRQKPLHRDARWRVNASIGTGVVAEEEVDPSGGVHKHHVSTGPAVVECARSQGQEQAQGKAHGQDTPSRLLADHPPQPQAQQNPGSQEIGTGHGRQAQ